MNEYGRIIADMPNLAIYLYSGDWDDTVPYTNTMMNLERLGMRQNGSMTPILDDKKEQHLGF